MFKCTCRNVTKNARVQFSDPKSIELELEWSLVHTIIGKVKNISRPGLRSLKYYFGNVPIEGINTTLPLSSNHQKCSLPRRLLSLTLIVKHPPYMAWGRVNEVD